jgi:chromosome segregation ATPase
MKTVGERDEALNQLDSARHSVDVLENRVKNSMSEFEGAANYIEELETKMAKAVDALKHAKLNMPHPDQLIDDTLAELEGGKE